MQLGKIIFSDDTKYPYLVNSGGETLRRLEVQCNVSLKLRPRYNQNMRIVTVAIMLNHFDML